MVTVNYMCSGYLVKQDTISEIDVNQFKEMKNYRLNHKNIKYYIYKCVYDIFDSVLTVFLKRVNNFKYDTFIPNYKQSIIEQLEYIGYVKSKVAGNGKHLITNHNGFYYFTDEDYSSGGMGYVAEGTVALAIAALSDDTDKNQWFLFPDGLCELCENESAIDEWGDFEGTPYPRKLTVNEIYSNID